MSLIDISVFIVRKLVPFIKHTATVVNKWLLSKINTHETIEVVKYKRKSIPNELPLFGDLNNMPSFSCTPHTSYSTSWRTVGYIQRGQVINYYYAVQTPRLEYKMEYRANTPVKDLDVIEIKYADSSPTDRIQIAYINYSEELLKSLHIGKTITLNRIFGEIMSATVSRDGSDSDNIYHSTKGILALSAYGIFAIIGISFIVVVAKTAN